MSSWRCSRGPRAATRAAWRCCSSTRPLRSWLRTAVSAAPCWARPAGPALAVLPACVMCSTPRVRAAAHLVYVPVGILAGRLPAHHDVPAHVPARLLSRLAIPATDPAVYSLIKFGNVSNHVVLTWTADDLAACADLNLPCADVSHLLAEPLAAAAGAGEGAGGGRWCRQAARLVSLQAASMGKGGPSTALASPACCPLGCTCRHRGGVGQA